MISNDETKPAIEARAIKYNTEEVVAVKPITGYKKNEEYENDLGWEYKIDEDKFSGKFLPEKPMQIPKATKRKIQISIQIQPKRYLTSIACELFCLTLIFGC